MYVFLIYFKNNQKKNDIFDKTKNMDLLRHQVSLRKHRHQLPHQCTVRRVGDGKLTDYDFRTAHTGVAVGQHREKKL